MLEKKKLLFYFYIYFFCREKNPIQIDTCFQVEQAKIVLCHVVLWSSLTHMHVG